MKKISIIISSIKIMAFKSVNKNNFAKKLTRKLNKYAKFKMKDKINNHPCQLRRKSDKK
jgi:hypothetical protein